MCSSIEIMQKIQEFLRENPEKHLQYRERINKYLQQHKVRYKDRIIEFSCEPFILTKELEQKFKELIATTSRIIRKVTNEYLENTEFRLQFPFSPVMEEMILQDPGYAYPSPLARYDIFWYGDDFKFCELNGDGTSAMNEAMSTDDALLTSQMLQDIFPEWEFSRYELFKSCLQELLAIYREFGGTSKPNIAICDFAALGTVEEFKRFQRVFEGEGYNTIIVDPRKLEYKAKKLYHGNFRIDLIYRRAVTQEVEKRFAEIQPLYRAYRDGNVCLVGSFRSQVMHNKAFFSILHDTNNRYLFDKSELRFIEKHIPRTYLLKQNLHKKVDIYDKDKFVLKPLDLYAGKNVVIGRDTVQEKWNELLQNRLNQPGYLLQEFCTPPEIELLNETNQINKYKSTLGLFVYHGKFRGIYQRVGRYNIIASIAEAIVRANIKVSVK